MNKLFLLRQGELCHALTIPPKIRGFAAPLAPSDDNPLHFFGMRAKVRPKYVLPLDGQWVGPPVLMLQLLGRPPLLLDGGKRLQEIRERGLATVPPILTVTSHAEAIKHLTLNQEYFKVAEHVTTYYPELKSRSVDGFAKITGLHKNRFQPVIRALRAPEERHKLPRRAIAVVKRLKQLRDQFEAGKPITLDLIDEVLGEFGK